MDGADSPLPTPPPDALADDATCPSCGYSLRGLTESGQCPECGHRYDPLTLGRCTPLPDTLTLVIDLGWPLAIFMLSLLLMVGAGAELAILLLPMAGAMCVLMVAYTPWRARQLVKRHVRADERARHPIAGAWQLGNLPFAVLCLSVAIGLPGIALCGTCLVSWVIPG